MKTQDVIYSAIAAGGQLRASAVSAKAMVEYAKNAHGLSPVSTVALGRLLCAGSLMSLDLKGASEKLTLRVKCGGPIGGLTVCADSKNNVKGYCDNPFVFLPSASSSSVSEAVGEGRLIVTKDFGLKQPFTGQVALVSGEIAEDLTYYFAISEQTPSVVALGVLLDYNADLLLKLASSQYISALAGLCDCYQVSHAGGFMIQAMPGADDKTLDTLENHIKNISSPTAMLAEGLTPKDILARVLEPFDYTLTAHRPTAFFCGCSQESMRGVLMSLNKEEIGDFPIEIVCPYCNRKYLFESI